MDENSFLDELKQIVVRRAAAMNLVDTLAFVSEVAERLEEDPVFGEFIPVEYSGTGSRSRPLRLHGYTELDESDGTVGLIIGNWTDSDEPETLLTAEVRELSARLENFLNESVTEKLNERIAEVNPAYSLATLLRDSPERISRIRLHIFSNKSLSQRFKEEQCGTVNGIPVERHVWDLKRLAAIYQSSREREAVEILLEDFGTDGIPYIEAAKSQNLRSFLCVVEGKMIADLFERYGSRLLEGNVRSFLGMKGGVNKGIRATIQDTPSLFFAYNNGIAATAACVTVEDVNGKSLITGLNDFQIVNGGQTTASILSARKKDRLSLEGVTVQLKLTEVDRDAAHDLIPKIAQYANTQNKIAIADFFANHPFHRKIEEISRRLQVPARTGTRIQSKWFYERSRGQYQNERLYLTSSKKDAFDLEYPAAQLINKTDLAIYDSAWSGKPFWSSLGPQKNFIKFAGQFSSSRSEVSDSEFWSSVNPTYNDAYYQQIVAIALIWKRAEGIVSAGKGDWYEGAYRPQIISYTLSLLFKICRSKGFEFDLGKVWTTQGIDSSIEAAIRSLAIEVQKVILTPPSGNKNVGEWCKKEACWNCVMQVHTPDLPGLDQWLIGKSDFNKVKKENRKQGIQDNGIALQSTLLELATNGYWRTLLKSPKSNEILSSTDRLLVSKASTTEGFIRVTREKDWLRLMEIKQNCDDEGFRIDESVT
jgi:hypothetical protein